MPNQILNDLEKKITEFGSDVCPADQNELFCCSFCKNTVSLDKKFLITNIIRRKIINKKLSALKIAQV